MKTRALLCTAIFLAACFASMVVPDDLAVEQATQDTVADLAAEQQQLVADARFAEVRGHD